MFTHLGGRLAGCQFGNNEKRQSFKTVINIILVTLHQIRPVPTQSRTTTSPWTVFRLVAFIIFSLLFNILYCSPMLYLHYSGKKCIFILYIPFQCTWNLLQNSGHYPGVATNLFYFFFLVRRIENDDYNWIWKREKILLSKNEAFV